MMHSSKNFWAAGNQEYFKEKSPVNVRVDATAHLAELFPRPKDADEYQPSPWFGPSGQPTGMYGPPLRRKRNVRMSQVGLRKCIRPLLE